MKRAFSVQSDKAILFLSATTEKLSTDLKLRERLRIHFLSVKGSFDGKRPHMPWVDPSVFKKAKREKTEHQGNLEI